MTTTRWIMMAVLSLALGAGFALSVTCGCSATTQQTVRHDAASVLACIPPAIVTLQSCRAAPGGTAEGCIAQAVAELVACALSAPPATLPAVEVRK